MKSRKIVLITCIVLAIILTAGLSFAEEITLVGKNNKVEKAEYLLTNYKETWNKIIHDGDISLMTSLDGMEKELRLVIYDIEPEEIRNELFSEIDKLKEENTPIALKISEERERKSNIISLAFIIIFPIVVIGGNRIKWARYEKKFKQR